MNNKAFIIGTFLLSALFLLSSCNIVKGSGNIVSEKRTVSEFNSVQLSGMGHIILTQANTQSLEIKTDDNIMPVLKTEVNNKKLVISIKENTIADPTSLTIYISMKDIHGLSVSGSGKIISRNKIQTEVLDIKVSGSGDIALENKTQTNTLNLEVSGSGNIKMAVDAKSIKTDISGSGNIDITGITESQELKISGSGKYSALQLSTKNADIKISGSGECRINVSDTLKADISGSGNLIYSGRSAVESEISGSGKIKNQ